MQLIIQSTTYRYQLPLTLLISLLIKHSYNILKLVIGRQWHYAREAIQSRVYRYNDVTLNPCSHCWHTRVVDFNLTYDTVN